MSSGKASSRVLTFAVGFRPGFHIASRTAHRKEKSLVSPLFLLFFTMKFWISFIINSFFLFRERTFPANSFSQELQGSSMLRIIGGRHDGNYTLLNEMRKLWISLETKNSRFLLSKHQSV